jgi:hypothetical protein
LKMLDQAIDRDIAAQRDNLSTKRGLLAESQSVFAMARQKFGDDQAAAEFTKARQNETLKNAAARYQGEARTEAMRANAAKLEQHFGLEERRADNNVQQLNAQYEAARLKAAAGAAASAASAEERAYDKSMKRLQAAAALDKTVAETEKLQSEARGGGEDLKNKEIINFEGVDWLVPKVGAKELRESAGAAMATQEQADTMRKLATGEYHTLFGTTDAKAQGELVRSALVAGVARVKSSGFNPSKEAEDSARDLVPDVPRVFGSGAFDATIKEIPALSKAQVRSQLIAAGAKRLDGAPAVETIKTYTVRK